MLIDRHHSRSRSALGTETLSSNDERWDFFLDLHGSAPGEIALYQSLWVFPFDAGPNVETSAGAYSTLFDACNSDVYSSLTTESPALCSCVRLQALSI